ncbi:thioredoxin domain-containing protein [Halorubellus sp. PRR65]|uniref:DsbA family protein n=1 Tax=Halorubellus sp. PRR65 TaxID=3098148 RepID=UPI002B25A4D2|nr:thioredoxin domain-containing protein [Halorubellus sp. PRR65]
MPDDRSTDEPPITVSRRTALAALGGALGLGAAGVYAASTLATDDGDALAGDFRREDGQSAHLEVNYAGSPVLGSLEADLRLFYWSDYQCPYCKRFDVDTLPKLAENHVATGDLAIVFLELPVFGADSDVAAAASKCAWRVARDDDPNAWGRWHRQVFAQQGDKNDGWASEDRLYEYTRGVDGVAEDELRVCMDERRDAVTAAVQEDVTTAVDDLGLRRATPAFAMSNVTTGKWLGIPGAQPYETFEKVVERLQET